MEQKLAVGQRRKKNLALQAALQKSGEQVDPVLGRPNNPFMHRITMETEEPNTLIGGYKYHEVEKLLYGAKEAREVKLVAKVGQDQELLDKVAEQEAEKKEIVMRILSMRNAENTEKEKVMTALAMEEFSRFEGDTGSPEVQAAVMTVHIYNYMRHIKANPQDHVHIRRVRMLTQKRQRILRYLKRDDPQRYFWCIEKLGLTDATVHMEFTFDRKYEDEFQVWPGRKMVKITKRENEERRRDRRIAKNALRRALTQGGLKSLEEEKTEIRLEKQEKQDAKKEHKRELREEAEAEAEVEEEKL